MFINATLATLRSQIWNVSPNREWKHFHHVPVSHQSSEGRVFIMMLVCFSVLFSFIVWPCLSSFLSTLNCTRPDILFWNSKTRHALIFGLCCSCGINRLLSLYCNTVRACVPCVFKKEKSTIRLMTQSAAKTLHELVKAWALEIESLVAQDL